METIAASPLLPGTRPIALHVRRGGRGEPLLILHGGWGYGYYPYDGAIAALDRSFVIPDRTGYGRSPRVERFPPRFHAAAATETERLLDALGIERCAVWGHSDGAVIATLLALRQPDRYSRLIVEAIHLDRRKPGSRAFFLQMVDDPDAFGERVTRTLAAEHGEEHWRAVLHADGQAWLDIAATPDDDLYEGRLHELRVPLLVLHGADDPRTEPGELDRLAREVPAARIELLAGGGHSPHTARGTAARCAALAADFLAPGAVV
ncbi:MAG TPA: alpha/beta hydrolase [Candidatus Limnocylindria bacterium]|nr:alpha/beta hydrolase [Candidatus Limnocylindria bacterium]